MMTMLEQHEPTLVYHLIDRSGHPIGKVVEPKSKPVLGKGEGTVLLIRG
jgi:hypothetical protein